MLTFDDEDVSTALPVPDALIKMPVVEAAVAVSTGRVRVEDKRLIN